MSSHHSTALKISSAPAPAPAPHSSYTVSHVPHLICFLICEYYTAVPGDGRVSVADMGLGLPSPALLARDYRSVRAIQVLHIHPHHSALLHLAAVLLQLQLRSHVDTTGSCGVPLFVALFEFTAVLRRSPDCLYFNFFFSLLI